MKRIIHRSTQCFFCFCHNYIRPSERNRCIHSTSVNGGYYISFANTTKFPTSTRSSPPPYHLVDLRRLRQPPSKIHRNPAVQLNRIDIERKPTLLCLRRTRRLCRGRRECRRVCCNLALRGYTCRRCRHRATRDGLTCGRSCRYSGKAARYQGSGVEAHTAGRGCRRCSLLRTSRCLAACYSSSR